MIIWIDQLFTSALVGTVDSTASLPYEDLVRSVAERSMYGFKANQAEGLTADQETEVLMYLDGGYRTFLLAHEWSFTRPVATSVLFADVAASVKDISANGLTLTVPSAEFFPTAVGRDVVFGTSSNGIKVKGYTSTTVIELEESAAGESAAKDTVVGQAASASTITATSAAFSSSDIGSSVTFSLSATSYTIWAHISTTQVVVTGNATGEVSGDTFTLGGVTYTHSGVPVLASAVTLTDADLVSSLVGKYLEYDGSGTAYLINAFKSTTELAVVGNSTAETSGDTVTIWDTFTITTSGAFRLPDDFGGLVSDVYFQAGDGRWVPLVQTGVSELLGKLQVSTGTGRPTICAVDPLAVSGTIGQRHDLLVWRIPSADYTIRYQYQVLPNKLSVGKHPYGGAMHAETLKFACLAAMELSKFNVANGPMKQQFTQLLSESIKRDNRGARANSLGIMVDARPGYSARGGDSLPYATNITSAGVSYP